MEAAAEEEWDVETLLATSLPAALMLPFDVHNPRDLQKT